MAQVSMTLNMDAQMKQRIDHFCALSGSTEEQTLADMLHMWERLVYIPWTEFERKENARKKMHALLARQRERVANGEIEELSLDDINEEIVKTRAERHAREARQ